MIFEYVWTGVRLPSAPLLVFITIHKLAEMTIKSF